jgi:hypothetical protein
MNFSIGILKSQQQFIHCQFHPDQVPTTQILPLEDIKDEPLSGFLYKKELLNEEIQAILLKQSELYPIRAIDEVGTNEETLIKAPFEQAFNLMTKIQNPWLLHNNLSLLDELFCVITHLNQLWPNERTAFFEELWEILRKNLGTMELKIIFNTLEKGTKENEKDKLVKAMISGTKKGNPLNGGEIEEQIMKHYESEFHKTFEIVEYKIDKSELVAVATIKKSPVLIMARAPQLTKLQKTLVKALFEGLSFQG